MLAYFFIPLVIFHIICFRTRVYTYIVQVVIQTYKLCRLINLCLFISQNLSIINSKYLNISIRLSFFFFKSLMLWTILLCTSFKKKELVQLIKSIKYNRSVRQLFSFLLLTRCWFPLNVLCVCLSVESRMTYVVGLYRREFFAFLMAKVPTMSLPALYTHTHTSWVIQLEGKTLQLYYTAAHSFVLFDCRN